MGAGVAGAAGNFKREGELSACPSCRRWCVQTAWTDAWLGEAEPRVQYRPTGGLTPLLYAARAGCLGCVEALLKGGGGGTVNIDLPNPDRMTAMMMAIDNSQYEVARYLLDRALIRIPGTRGVERRFMSS